MVIDTSKLSFNQPKPPRLSMEQVYPILKNNLKSIPDFGPDSIMDQSKYVKLAKEHNYRNYRLFTYQELLTLKLKTSFSRYTRQLLFEGGAAVAIFNEMNGELISIVMRSTMYKEFVNYSLYYSIYGYDMIDPNFKYGDWLVITEGLYDADVLRQIYPNVVATQTSSVTRTQMYVLRLMTDHFIIAFDDDAAGEAGFQKAIIRLGTGIKKLNMFPGDKDIGVMEEKRYDDPKGFDVRYKYYNSCLKEIFEMGDVEYFTLG